MLAINQICCDSLFLKQAIHDEIGKRHQKNQELIDLLDNHVKDLNKKPAAPK